MNKQLVKNRNQRVKRMWRKERSFFTVKPGTDTLMLTKEKNRKD
jgi:hypothetical protein